MAVTEDRKFTKLQVYELLEAVKGKTLGEVDQSHQFDRTRKSEKITGIAGDVIEQSVFGYERDSKQECDIEIDGVLTELKTTGVRIPKGALQKAKGKGIKDLYLIRTARIGNKAEIHPESEDKDPRIIFELAFLESLPNYIMLKPNIFNTYRNTVLGRVMDGLNNH